MKEPEFSYPKKYSGINTRWLAWKQQIINKTKGKSVFLTMKTGKHHPNHDH